MARIIVLREDADNPEGPVSLPDGSWLYTEMDLGVITLTNSDGSIRREIAHTGLPNGLTVDATGDIWVAEARQRALLRVTMTGEVHWVSGGPQDLPFLLPNDLCFGPDGALYMTDSGLLLEELQAVSPPVAVYNLPFDGRVFRIDPTTGSCQLLDRGFQLTNGIAFNPDGLYVAETLTGNIYRYRFVDGVVEEKRHLFGNVMIKPPIEYGRIAGPDGMAFDIKGNLYVAVLVEGNITVLDPNGAVKERIPVEGTMPTNLAFNRSGQRKIMVTEASNNRLLLIDTEFEGLPIYY